ELIDEINAQASGAAPAAGAPTGQPVQPDVPSFSDDGFPVAAELLVEVAHALKHDPDVDLEIATAPEPAPAPTITPIPSAPARSELAPIRETVRESEPKETATATSSIRVNVDVIENLMTLISELVLTRNQLLQMQRGQKDNEFKVPLQRLSHITSDLQDGVTR